MRDLANEHMFEAGMELYGGGGVHHAAHESEHGARTSASAHKPPFELLRVT